MSVDRQTGEIDVENPIEVDNFVVSEPLHAFAESPNIDTDLPARPEFKLKRVGDIRVEVDAAEDAIVNKRCGFALGKDSHCRAVVLARTAAAGAKSFADRHCEIAVSNRDDHRLVASLACGVEQ
jgi:hypothetical protein